MPGDEVWGQHLAVIDAAGTVGDTAKPGTDRGPGQTQIPLNLPLSMT